MKKLTFILVLLSFCTLFGCNRIAYYRDYEKFDKECETYGRNVIDVVISRDKEALRNLFASNALQNSDFDKGFEYLGEVLQGELLEIEFIYADEQGTYSAKGKSLYPRVVFYLTTTENTYELYFEYYKQDPENENKLRRLRLDTFEAIAANSYYTYGFGSCLGLYYPNMST